MNNDYIDCKIESTLHTIGAKIGAERNHQNLTRDDLEELSGVSSDTIKRIEAGYVVKIDKFLRVIFALDVPVDMFFPCEVTSKEDMAKRIKRMIDELVEQ